MKKQLHNLAGIGVFCIALSASVFAQPSFYHHPQRKAFAPSARAATGQGSNIDVVYHRCFWRINPDSPSTTAPAKFLKGNVTTYFVAKQAPLGSITFDFNSVHTIDSVKYHGNKLSAASIAWNTTKVLQLTLPTAIATVGTLDSITIFYKGTPPAVNGEALGYQRGGSSTNNYVYTLSECYEDRDWWPCKHDMQDKIDSMDIVVSVPSSFWVAANGKMTDSALVGNSRVFTFKHRYPIASYLVSLGVAKYRRYHRAPVNINGTNVPIVYNLFPNKTTTSYNNIVNTLDKCRLELAAFSSRFGDYPFKKEKFGFYEFGYGGGMEHQTFAGMSGSAMTSWSIVAHELAHQWFGDQVTCATWGDLWINEGFARYCESLAAEWVTGLGNATTHRGNIKAAARSASTTPIFIRDFSTSNTVWTSANYTAVYERGAMVVSMLRALLGDEKFFQACRNFLADPQLSYRAAATADVQRHFEAGFGKDLSAFFSAWVYGYGTPSYALDWNPSGNAIKLRLRQSRSTGASVAHFPIPVVLRVTDASGARTATVTLYDRGDSLFLAGNGSGAGVAGNTIAVNLGFVPATVTFDPGNATMATCSTPVLLTALRPAAVPATLARLEIFPNPARGSFTLLSDAKATGTVAVIINIDGHTVLRRNIVNRAEKISTAGLKPGTYTVELLQDGTVVAKEKLVVQ
jgi:aminopeptidase N